MRRRGTMAAWAAQRCWPGFGASVHLLWWLRGVRRCVLRRPHTPQAGGVCVAHPSSSSALSGAGSPQLGLRALLAGRGLRGAGAAPAPFGLLGGAPVPHISSACWFARGAALHCRPCIFDRASSAWHCGFFSSFSGSQPLTLVWGSEGLSSGWAAQSPSEHARRLAAHGPSYSRQTRVTGLSAGSPGGRPAACNACGIMRAGRPLGRPRGSSPAARRRDYVIMRMLHALL